MISRNLPSLRLNQMLRSAISLKNHSTSLFHGKYPQIFTLEYCEAVGRTITGIPRSRTYTFIDWLRLYVPRVRLTFPPLSTPKCKSILQENYLTLEAWSLVCSISWGTTECHHIHFQLDHCTLRLRLTPMSTMEAGSGSWVR